MDSSLQGTVNHPLAAMVDHRVVVAMAEDHQVDMADHKLVVGDMEGAVVAAHPMISRVEAPMGVVQEEEVLMGTGQEVMEEEEVIYCEKENLEGYQSS